MCKVRQVAALLLVGLKSLSKSSILTSSRLRDAERHQLETPAELPCSLGYSVLGLGPGCHEAKLSQPTPMLCRTRPSMISLLDSCDEQAALLLPCLLRACSIQHTTMELWSRNGKSTL